MAATLGRGAWLEDSVCARMEGRPMRFRLLLCRVKADWGEWVHTLGLPVVGACPLPVPDVLLFARG